MKDEAYSLKVTPREIVIRAKDGQGCFYALQTLRQMLPPGYEDSGAEEYSVPADEQRLHFRISAVSHPERKAGARLLSVNE